MQRDRTFVRVKLAEYNLTQVWLRNELEKRGVITDKTEMCSVLKGNRRGDKAESIIKNSVEILEDYESKYASKP